MEFSEFSGNEGWYKTIYEKGLIQESIRKMTNSIKTFVSTIFFFTEIYTYQPKNSKMQRSEKILTSDFIYLYLSNFYPAWEVYFKHFGNVTLTITAQHFICFFLKKDMLPIQNSWWFRMKKTAFLALGEVSKLFSKPFYPFSF